MIFVDTNYFLRFLLRDNEEQLLKAKDLFLRGAGGEVRLTTSTLVLFELYWVFKSYYKKEKSEIISILGEVIDLDFIRFGEEEIIRASLDLFSRTNLSFEDCYNLSFARANGIRRFETFDAKLAKEFKHRP